MPPRRSSRSTRASVDPQPEALPAKRKREDPHEKENILSKTKSRSKVKGLQEIPESDVDDEQEQEDSPPPVKKSRPSLDPETDEEEPQLKSRKARGPKKEVDDEPPTRRGKRAVSSKSMAESGDEEEANSDEDVKPKPRRAAPKARRVAHVSDEEDSAEEINISDFEDDTNVKSASKKAKNKRATKAKPKAAPAKSKSRASAAPSRPDPAEAVTPVAAAPPVHDEEDDEEEEEEKSLFDPPPMPTPSQLAQPVVEEPTGPKSRLVIHKMALVNFKSYAGRQEIGPFHKVRATPSVVTNDSLIM